MSKQSQTFLWPEANPKFMTDLVQKVIQDIVRKDWHVFMCAELEYARGAYPWTTFAFLEDLTIPKPIIYSIPQRYRAAATNRRAQPG